MTTLVLSILKWSSTSLQIRRTTIKAWMSLDFGKIPSLTTELAVIEHLKNQWIMLWPVFISAFISSPWPKATDDLIEWNSSRRPSIHTFKHEYLWDYLADQDQISSGALFGRGLAALGFGLDRIRTLVSMATDSSHRVIMGNILWPL